MGGITCKYVELSRTSGDSLISSKSRWNSARSIAAYLDNHPDLYADGSVLELGAGGGLPSIVTANNGAEKVRSVSCPAMVFIS